MSHFKRRILSDPGSYALLSGTEDATTAVVFVHGFTGNSESTWFDFQNLVDIDAADWWKRCDLFFYDYKSTESNIAVLAERFRNFLKDLFPRPKPELLTRPSIELEKIYQLEDTLVPLTESYQRLVMVGHSLGGVIIRQAVSDAALDFENTNDNEKMQGGEPNPTFRWLASSVRLFAPAIFGFNPTQFAGFCYHLTAELPRLGTFLRPILHANAVHQELRQDSVRLREIRRLTEKFAAKYPWMESLRCHLIFGAEDTIVYTDRYDCDPVREIVEHQDHRSICKPDLNYRRPLEFVSYELSKPASI
jgi:pimeloyl-ACP methyl ester carboxylesterase